MDKPKKKKSNALLIIAIVAVLGFGGAFGYYAYDYYLWWRDGQLAQESTDMMVDIFQEQVSEISNLVAAMPALATIYDDQVVSVVFSSAVLDEARAMTDNADIVAYIYIEGTNVNNVVLQGPDNSFYLYRDMFRNFNVNGALFMDYRNTPDFNDPNTIIYGHNMRNGTMFHDLRYFTSQEFAQRHPHINVITDDYVFIYEIFSVFTTRIDFYYIQVFFADQDEFGALVNEISRRGIFNTGVAATADDNILVLSTCTNVDDDTRIVVVGRLAQIIEIEREE